MKRGRHSDPTIPRKGKEAGNPKEAQQHAEPRVGWLVDRGGDGVWLVTRDGKSKHQARVASGSFANNSEGFHRAPRPFLYDATGNVLVQGDYFLVVYLGGDAAKPVLLGGWRPTNPDDPDFFPANPIGEDPNPARLRMVARDSASGAITGHVQAVALDGGHSLELVVGGTSFGAGMRISVDFDAGTIELGSTTPGAPRVQVSASSILSGIGMEQEVVLKAGWTLLQGMAAEMQALAGLLGIPVPNTAAVVSTPPTTPILSATTKVD